MNNKFKDKRAFVIKLNRGDDYQMILQGPPETFGIHSGRVVLKPGESVGEHNTQEFEEILIILEGKGEAFCEGASSLPVAYGDILYIPPYILHNIKNTGSSLLKYIYVVAPTK